MSFGFFIYQGWLEMGIFGRIFKRLRRVPSIEDSKVKYPNVSGLSPEERAQIEENRRKEESTLRRRFSMAMKDVGRVLKGGSVAGNKNLVWKKGKGSISSSTAKTGRKHVYRTGTDSMVSNISSEQDGDMASDSSGSRKRSNSSLLKLNVLSPSSKKNSDRGSDEKFF